MKNQKFKLGSVVVMLGLISGCGGNHPLELFGDPNSNPNLILPVRTGNIYTSIAPFTPSHTYFALTTTVASTPIIAPGEGVVTNLESTANGYTITIHHTPLVISEVSRVASPAVRPGDFVSAGTTLGVTTISNSEVDFRVYYNGVATCPVSFMASGALTAYNGYFTGSTYCTQ